MKKFALIFLLGTWSAVAQNVSVLHSFDFSSIGSPNSGVIRGTDGAFYGTTWSTMGGTVFKINADGSNFLVLHTFTLGFYGDPMAGVLIGDGLPEAGLVQGGDGVLYGTTSSAGANNTGIVFKLNTDGSGFVVLHSFDRSTTPSTYFTRPSNGHTSELIQGRDGALYGTTATMGAYGYGTAFKLNTDGSGFQILHSFSGGADGSAPSAGLLQGRDGELYGTTFYTDGAFGTGLPGGAGTIFKLSSDGSYYSIIHNFTHTTTGQDDQGANPAARLIQGGDGTLYGSTSAGGSAAGSSIGGGWAGTVFRVNTDGSDFSVLHDFIQPGDGSSPSGLIQGADGTFYGTTSTGNPYLPVNDGYGKIFSLSPNGSFSVLHTFGGSDGAFLNSDSSTPFPYLVLGAGSPYLVLGASGSLYGTSPAGGSVNGGTFFDFVTGPAFIVNPVSVTVASGRSAVFNAVAAGTPAPAYQWIFNGASIPGATDPVLDLTGVTSANAGTYACAATYSSGSITSTAATLTVVSASSPGYLVNLSARANVGVGNNLLIGGFRAGGAGTKHLLVRGAGPALGFALSGYLTTPQLTLLDNNGLVIASNLAWANAPTAGPSAATDSPMVAPASLMNNLGAYPYQAGSADTAMVVTAPTGNSTAQVAGVGGTAGIGLVEFYDADTVSSPSARLINLSARANVGTGNNVLIGGFAIGGNTADTVLIRAVGPGLADTVPSLAGSTLSQPILTLFSGGNPIFSNTGWGGDPTIASTFTTVGAFSLNPAHADSALLVTLPPGNYTAQVSGLNGGTGIALVEIYEVP